MKIVDTRKEELIHPIIIALEAYFKASEGEKIEIVFESNMDFNYLKDYLSERGIGFREIYTGTEMRIQIQKQE